ncbi:MAG: NAD(P)-dependent oxidoreductase [Hymenobacter sp.]
MDSLLRQGLGERGVLLTNARGAHGIPMGGEHFDHGLVLRHADAPDDPGAAVAGKIGREVIRDKWELHGQTMLVLGLGDIGGTLAQKSRALGMRVLGVRRSGERHEHCEAVFTLEGLLEALPQADHVALCLPLTEETSGVIGERELRSMKPTATSTTSGAGRRSTAWPCDGR